MEIVKLYNIKPESAAGGVIAIGCFANKDKRRVVMLVWRLLFLLKTRVVNVLFIEVYAEKIYYNFFERKISQLFVDINEIVANSMNSVRCDHG